MKINDVLVKPLLTEKSTGLAKTNTYAFEVHEDASKSQVKGAVEELFKTKVQSVRMIIRKGKTRRVGRKMKTKQLANRKIAYVKIKEGKIDLFPQA